MNTESVAPECQRIRDVTSDYLDGVLPHESAGSTVRHLDECLSCARFLDELRTTVGFLEQLCIEAPLPSSEQKALRAFQECSQRVESGGGTGEEEERARSLWRGLSPWSQEERLRRVAADKRLRSEELCGFLRRQAQEMVDSNPRAAVRRAEVSTFIADLLPPKKATWSLNADCWSTLAMVKATASDVAGAGEALKRAEECFARGDRNPLSKGRLLAARSWMSFTLGRLAESEVAALDACRVFEDLGDRTRAVAVLNNLSGTYASGGQYSEAVRVLTEALTLLNDRDDPARLLLAVQKNLALVYCEMGWPEQANSLLPVVERLARDVGGESVVHLKWLKGTIARVQGDWQAALQVFSEVGEHFRQRGEYTHFVESSLDTLRTLLAMGEWAAAIQLTADTSRMCRELTQDAGIIGALQLLEKAAVKKSLDEIQIKAVRALIGCCVRRTSTQ